MSCWANLKEESDLWEIFPSGSVPIVSIVPIIPREEGCPLCYVVKGTELTSEQLHKLAERIYQQWQPECVDLQQAIDYVLSDCPLKVSHFSGIGTDDYFQVPWGAALNVATRMEYQ